MPVYDYQCDKCQAHTRISRTIAQRDDPTTCACGEPMRRAFSGSPATIVVQGGERQRGLDWRFGYALAHARQERAAHVDRFGRYREYVPQLQGTVDVPDHPCPEETTHMGDVQDARQNEAIHKQIMEEQT